MIASGFGLVTTVEAGMVTQVGPWEAGGGGLSHILGSSNSPSNACKPACESIN